jgi:hypothetical protein
LAAPVNYVLGPGDEVRLRVWGAVDFRSSLVIDRDGSAQIPKVGLGCCRFHRQGALVSGKPGRDGMFIHTL